MTTSPMDVAALVRMRSALDAVLAEHDTLVSEGDAESAKTALDRATASLGSMVTARLGSQERDELERLGLTGASADFGQLDASALSGWLTGHLNFQMMTTTPTAKAPARKGSAHSAVGPRMAGGYL